MMYNCLSPTSWQLTEAESNMIGDSGSGKSRHSGVNHSCSAEQYQETDVMRERVLFRCIRWALWTLAFSSLCAGLQWKNGAYDAGFGCFPDEPAHFVTGLMVYKYATTAIGTNPMAFAERFYAHYPAVAFGHWPPVFYVLQAGWYVVFGESRAAALLLLAVLAGVTGTLIYYATRERLGREYGLAMASVFICLPIVQRHTGSVMAEMPLALFTFAATLAVVSFISRPDLKRAAAVAICLTAAILTKGNGWALFIVPVALLILTRSYGRTTLRKLAIALVIVLICCLPFAVLTMKMTKDGWDQQSPSMAFFAHALPTLGTFHLSMLGAPLFAFVCVGIISTLIRPLISGSRIDTMWLANAVVVVTVLLFHAFVPTGLETRKIYMSIPSLLMFAAAGMKAAVDMLPPAGSVASPVFSMIRVTVPLVLSAVICYEFAGQSVFKHHANMGPVARWIIGKKEFDRSALLVATENPNGLEEVSFVAEMAAGENGNFGHAVLRAGKIISESSWLGFDYSLRYSDTDHVSAALDAIPVSVIVLCREHSTSASRHSQLLERMIAGNPDDWREVVLPSNGAGIDLFRPITLSNKAVQLPVLDLRRKLGRNIVARF